MLNLREQIAGYDQEVPLLDGRHVRYVNLDNAASTPPFKAVTEAIDRFIPFYSSVHRGTGFKSRLSTEAYDLAHRAVADFVGADAETDTVIFGKNTTEAINKLAYRIPLAPEDVVVTSQMEHHSNDLPWRHRARVIHVGTEPSGKLDQAELEAILRREGERVKMVAICGASNVTGWIQPIHEIASAAHEVGAKILVDAAQLAPHRAINMLAPDDPAHLDFVALSAHKLYAPFGTGALIGPKETFMQSPPEYRGGGTVDVVTLEEVEWAGMPDRDEAGSPNVIGAVALAAAIKKLELVGMERIAEHERELMAFAHARLAGVSEIVLYCEESSEQRVGVVPFNLNGRSHFLVAAALGFEHGVGVRSGCFCAHPYVVKLLDLDESTTARWRTQILDGDRTEMPGMVRMSFGCYNQEEDVDRLIEGLERISAGDLGAAYQQNPATGEFTPVGHEEAISSYFEL